MILSNLRDEWRHEQSGSWRRVSMDVCWEDCEVAPQRLYFESTGATAERFRPNPNGFAIACMPLAAGRGERLLQVEGSLCSRLQAGLPAINQFFHEWYPGVPLLEIDASDGYALTEPPEQPATASLLSGGVDGLTCIRRNRLDYPLDHPDSIRGCITLFGNNAFDLDKRGPRPERLRAFDELLGRLQGLADREKFTLHPVRTNVRSLWPSYRLWQRMGYGAGNVAVGQLFQGSFDRLLLASDGDGPNPPLWGGSHPLFDHHFSTNSVRVVGSEQEMTRKDKVRLLLDWAPGRELMQPCHQVKLPPSGQINCGRCVKCVRTQLMLIAEGRLHKVSAFSDDDIGPLRVALIPITSERTAGLFAQGAKDLIRVGRYDLTWAIRLRLLVYRLLRR